MLAGRSPGRGAIMAEPLTPSSESERIETLDLLRGAGVLGILLMNIYAFSMPGGAYFSPTVYGGTSILSYAVWIFTYLFAETKFYSIFSLLFGAGIILFTRRLEEREVRPRGPYYRRMFSLFFFGIVHAVFLWYGDILLTYAWCGFWLYLFRRNRVRSLAIAGIVAIGIALAGMYGFGSLLHYSRSLAEGRPTVEVVADTTAVADAGVADTAAVEEESLATGMEELNEGLREMWEGFRTEFEPTREEVEETVATYRSDYGTILLDRLENLAKSTGGALFFFLFAIGGIMLLGMATFKSGILTGDRGTGWYGRLAVVGYGFGIPLGILGAVLLFRHDFDVTYRFSNDAVLHGISTAGIVAGHVGLLVWIQKRGSLPGLRARLRATGRMAFTNYIMQTLVCTTLFYGYGFGFYGRLDRPAQMLVVVILWLAQLLWSPAWMRRFHYGPMEWLWRTMTYGTRPPMRRRDPDPAVTP
ncbi:MAG: DUF418 domain-containing protein [Candidatus Eisenbacteria bacterium]|nr:DUF418 domain-containing protein [Candidatus Latescibacterota bacterium]MBD3300816.1 DUF418 domain-containing protein [Candidatus Eisenbacteria bacterium]